MSKHKGVDRYTDKATGRPVFDMPLDMLGASFGRSQTKTQRRARSRWHQGAHGAGKGDMPRPQDKTKYDEGYERTFGHG